MLARWCHGWIPEGPPEVIHEGVARLTRLAAEAGRASTRLEIRAQSPLYIGDDDEAREKVGRNLDYELVGSTERIVSLLAQYRDAGIDAMNLRCFADDEASLPRTWCAASPARSCRASLEVTPNSVPMSPRRGDVECLASACPGPTTDASLEEHQHEQDLLPRRAMRPGRTRTKDGVSSA